MKQAKKKAALIQRRGHQTGRHLADESHFLITLSKALAYV